MADCEDQHFLRFLKQPLIPSIFLTVEKIISNSLIEEEQDYLFHPILNNTFRAIASLKMCNVTIQLQQLKDFQDCKYIFITKCNQS